MWIKKIHSQTNTNPTEHFNIQVLLKVIQILQNTFYKWVIPCQNKEKKGQCQKITFL